MKVVVAMDSFKGSLSSMEAGKAIRSGIYRADSNTQVVIQPLADGGEGTVNALVHGMGGTIQSIQVTGSTGKKVNCDYGIIEQTKTALIEIAGGLGFAFQAFLHGKLDSQSVMGKAPIGVAALAKKYHKPVIAFAGSVMPDAKVCNNYGIDAYFPILRHIETLEEAMRAENAIRNMEDTAEQVFRLFCLKE